VAKVAVFFFMGNHSGLMPMAENFKKASAETTFWRSGESSVKVRNYSWLS
jgi:hypothetical protein